MQEELNANRARYLDKLLRYYENMLADPFRRGPMIETYYQQVLDKIAQLTDPILNATVYSIPGIRKPDR